MLTEFHLYSASIGLIAGVVGGLLPGFGNLMTMLIITPWIIHLPPIDLIICYAVMTQISQFVGSLTSVFTGVPGEASSMPTVKEIKRVPIDKLGEVVANTAVGSVFAALITVLFCWVFLSQFNNIAYFFRTEVVWLLFVIAMFFIVKYSDNTRIESILLLLLGFAIGQVGWNNRFGVGVMTFGVPELYQGVPMELVMVCLFALPQLYQMGKVKIPAGSLAKIPLAWPTVNYIKLTWYSIVGFIGGLVPGLTTVFSSQAAYASACAKTDDPIERIVASETANNSGAISQLIPLLVLGLPLVASEAYILSMMETKNFIAGPEAGIEYFLLSIPALVISAIAGLIVAWPLASKILAILRVRIVIFRTVMLLTLFGYIIWQGVLDRNLLYVLSLMLVLSLVGWLVRNKDTTGLVFGFFISHKIMDHTLRLFDLYT